MGTQERVELRRSVKDNDVNYAAVNPSLATTGLSDWVKLDGVWN